MTQVFISFKNTINGNPTKDSILAKKLYDFLKSNNIDVFMSNSSLAEIGHSEFKHSIDAALEESEILIVVGTNEEYILSPWVKYEWDNFHQDILSGVKKNGEIFCLFDDFKGSVPRSLRHKQIFSFESQSLNLLLEFISNKLNITNSKKSFVCSLCGKIFTSNDISGCRYHPLAPEIIKEKNFDGSVVEKLVYPCCGKIANKNFTTFIGGCVFGNHKP